MRITISLICIFYNESKYIQKTLESIYNQNNNYMFDIELILIDDNSNDGTYDIVNDYINNNEKDYIHPILIKNETNVGPGLSRRKGIELSSGKYIMFIDGDDYYIDNDCIRNAFNSIIKNDADIVEFGIKQQLLDYYQILTSKETQIFENLTLTEKAYELFYKQSIIFLIWNKIYKRELFDKIQYSDDKNYDDILTIPLLVNESKKYVQEPFIGINYRYKFPSITRTHDLKSSMNIVEALYKLCDYYEGNMYVIRLIYNLALKDLKTLLVNQTKYTNPYFNKAKEYNEKFLSYIFRNHKENNTNL